MKQFKSRQRGFTLIEAGAWMLLAGIVMYGALKAVGGGFASQKESTTQQEMIDLAAAAMRMKLNSPTYAGVTCTKLVEDKYINTKWTSCTSVNPYGGNYTVDPNSSNAVMVDVSATGLPEDVCRRLETNFAKTSLASCSGTALTVTFGE